MALNYAINKVAARSRAEDHRGHHQDPLPGIKPSLLNSADIKRYVAETGMIHPFKESDCKTAKYKGRIGGKCVYWDETGKQTVYLGKKQDVVEIKRNSITYVPVDLDFYLPNYIAVRFNLVIDLVYKGLLLGTGPIVDPGFQGRIWIPLHNLTSNEYILEYNDALVWFEFTKTSAVTTDTSCLYDPFKNPNRKLDIDDYLKDATGGVNTRIMSSIPGSVLTAEKKAEDARIRAEKAAAKVNRIAWGTIAGLTITLLLSYFTLVADLRRSIDKLGIEVEFLKDDERKGAQAFPVQSEISGALDLNLMQELPRPETKDNSQDAK